MIEPTPAWQTTTRASRIALGELVEGQEVDPLAGAVRLARGAVLHEQRPRRRRAPRRRATSRSNGCSLVPMVTRIMQSSEEVAGEAQPRRAARRARATARRCRVGDRRDHPRAERQPLDAGEALDVDDGMPQQLRRSTRTARRRRRPWSGSPPAARAGSPPGEPQVAQQVRDVAVGRPERVDARARSRSSERASDLSNVTQTRANGSQAPRSSSICSRCPPRGADEQQRPPLTPRAATPRRRGSIA